MGLSPVIRNILIGVPIGIAFVETVGYVARVDGISMQPSLNPDATTDYVFLNRWTIKSNNINRGEIISFTSPKQSNQTFIKRVIALEGDEIKTINYKLPFLKIPQGYCWVEGDHTGHSIDSNTFGPLSINLITARASHIVWPPSRWQYLEASLPKDRQPIQST